MKNAVILGFGLILGTLPTAGVEAQSCVGMPAGPSGVYAGGQFESEPEWGGELGFTSEGTGGVRAQYLWEPPVDDPRIQNEQHSASLLAAVPFAASQFEVCPALGVEWTVRIRSSENVDIWSVPVGVGLGRSFPVGDAAILTPFLFPQAVYVTGRPQFDTSLENGFTRLIPSDDSEAVDARLDFGALLQTGRFYASAAVRIQTDFEVVEGTRTEVERPILLTVGWHF